MSPILLISTIEFSEASCLRDLDWPDKPCYDTFPRPSLIAQIEDWRQYYYEKDSEWMKDKKAEMLQALSQNRLGEWILQEYQDVDVNNQIKNPNWNVCYYYYLYGDVPSCKSIKTNFTSPYKQLKEGVSHDSIICNEGLELIFKKTNGSPACVKPATFWKLLDFGWTSM